MRVASSVATLLLLWEGSSVSIPTVKLNNGVEMPVLAFAANVWSDSVCQNATSLAMQAGFRFIWSSALVGESCQKAQAVAIKASGLPRAELFIAGTVNDPSCSGSENCYAQTKTMAEAQFQVLGVDTLDMIMLDYPSSSPGCDGVLGQWKAFEELYDAKRVRTVAVSNFNPAQLKCLSGHRVPAVNQMPFSVGHGKDTVVSDDAKFNIVVQAYSPLGSGGLAHDDLCISIGKKYGKSSVQVALKWILQSKVTIATQSTSFDHLKSDVDLFDFALSDAEMSQLNAYSPRSFIYT